MVAQLLLGTVVMGLANTWSLRSGFSDYLLQREQKLLQAFADVASERLAASHGLQAFRSDPQLLKEILDRIPALTGEGGDLEESRGLAGPPGGPPDFPPGFDMSNPPRAGGPPEPPRPNDFGGRIAIFDLRGNIVAGYPLAPDARIVEQPITVHGDVIAYVRSTVPAAPAGIDAEFLHRQRISILTAALLMLLTSSLLSWLIARHWARPLNDIQAATARVAAGDFNVRMQERGSVEIAAAISNINTMIEALKRLEAARRRWLADISHELRTPVTVLRGEIESLLDGVRQPTPAAVKSLHEEVVAVSALLDDVHLVSIADLGKMPCHFAGMDMVAVAARAVERFSPAALDKGLEVTLNVSVDYAPVLADVGRIEQVLGNLLSNAIKYTSAPGRIAVSVARTDSAVLLIIEDTAPAPMAEEIERLFEPFYRVDTSRSRYAGGSGLGLAVCKAIIDAHHGQIVASASALGGLCVQVSLPSDGV